MLYPTSPPCLPIWIASAKPCNPRHWKHWFEKHINVRGEGGRGWRNKKHCSGAQRSSWSSTASTFVFNSDIWQPCAVSIKCRMVCRGTWMWVISSARQKNEQRGEEEEKYRERERRERERSRRGERQQGVTVCALTLLQHSTHSSFVSSKLDIRVIRNIVPATNENHATSLQSTTLAKRCNPAQRNPPS